MKTKKVLEKAIKTYGRNAQLIMTFEEISELQKALCKWMRDGVDTEAITEEIADVEIMIEQIKMIFDIHDAVEFEKQFKINRLEKRLEGAELR